MGQLDRSLVFVFWFELMDTRLPSFSIVAISLRVRDISVQNGYRNDSDLCLLNESNQTCKM